MNRTNTQTTTQDGAHGRAHAPTNTSTCVRAQAHTCTPLRVRVRAACACARCMCVCALHESACICVCASVAFRACALRRTWAFLCCCWLVCAFPKLGATVTPFKYPPRVPLEYPLVPLSTPSTPLEYLHGTPAVPCSTPVVHRVPLGIPLTNV